MADKRYKVFFTVARLMSFTKAAETLHMTQPAVTFQIKQLEDYFDTRLFNRNHNKISLTEAGRIMYEYSEKILELYDRLQNDIQSLTNDIKGLIKIGATSAIAEYVLPNLLVAFKKKYPTIRISIQIANTESIINMLESNTLDIGLVEATISNKNINIQVCHLDEIIVICDNNHPLKNHKNITLQELKKYEFLGRESGSGSRKMLETYLNEQGLRYGDLNVIIELGSSGAIKTTVEQGVGISIESRTSIKKELALGTLVAIPLSPPLYQPFSYAHQKYKFRNHAVREFLDFATIHCKEHGKKYGFIAPSEEDQIKFGGM